MQASFEDAIRYVLMNEGGYAEPPMVEAPTNFGVSLSDLEHFKGKNLSDEDLKNLTKADASQFYLHTFWAPNHLDKLVDTKMATAILDTAVLHGSKVAVKYSQKVCSLLGFQLIPDGEMGTKTLYALNHIYRNVFIRRYELMVFASYEAIISRYPEDGLFRAGWEARAQRLLVLV